MKQSKVYNLSKKAKKMSYYIIINFPFRSINDTKYCLSVAINSSSDLSDVVDLICKDNPQVFRRGIYSSGEDVVHTVEGVLTGTVRAVDDEREDIFDPLVCSKLKFNIAVQVFPGWLMEYCKNRQVKAVVYYDDGLKHEVWRGYLIDQTLSLTVVEDKLSVPLVAVDEVTMAKYIKLKPSLDYVASGVRWATLFGMMEYYHDLHHTIGLGNGAEGFGKLYTILGLTTTNRMLWHRNIRITDDDGDDVNNIPATFCVNFDRWLVDEESTWADLFGELFDYLCVTFAVGSYGGMLVHDAYLLTCPTDLTNVQQFVYTFTNHSTTSHSYDVYQTIPNPTKLGANLQVTTEPDLYKTVKVTSKPERWKTHEYLTEEHYKELSSGEVKYAWGVTDDPDDGPCESFGWHKLKYLKPDSKEADYLTIPACANGEGYLMARNGELPYDDLESCDGKTEPDASCDGSLDFITFKEGCCCVKIGSGTISGVDENKLLKPYFLIMNHMWGSMINHANHTMQTTHLADTPWLKLRPLGINGAVHPSEKHYLKITMDVMFVRENFPTGSTHNGNPRQHNWFPAQGIGYAMQAVEWSSPAMIMPIDETVFDFETDAGPYSGAYNATLLDWDNLSFTAYIHIGRHYFNGSAWAYVAPGGTPPTCSVSLKNSTTETRLISKTGYYSLETKSYYYTVSNPWMGNPSVGRNTENAMLADLDGISIHTQPVDGVLEMEILGQVHFQKNILGTMQSVPWILLSKIEINYTDDSEMIEKELRNEVKQTFDNASTSKTTLEKELKMATPPAAGFFNNALVYDGGKSWHNVTRVMRQDLAVASTFELLWAGKLMDQYSHGQTFVELTMPIMPDDNIHNVCFRITSLTEVAGTFLPIRREFDFVKETMRVKVQRRNYIYVV